MKTPFDILDVGEDASDEVIKKAYLRKVRQYTPERAPQQFQEIRAAFEAIQTRKQRLRYQLFHHEPPSIDVLLEHALQQTTGQKQRLTEQIFTQALAESLNNG